MITLLGEKELAALRFFVCGLCIVCHDLFVLPLGVICKLCSVIIAIPRYLLYYFPASIFHKSIAGHYRPVSYPDGPITARYRFM